MTKIIETQTVKVQASLVPTIGLTPLKVYEATCEVTEHTTRNRESATNGQSWITERKSIENIYTIVDDDGNERRFGSEFFRQI
ncbi:MAG: hypothetical protein ACYSQZ_05555 [Planctomycetota bacterium]|jgi:hypothetical protein